MARENVDHLAQELIDQAFPVLRLKSAADGMLDLIRERVQKLKLFEERNVVPFMASPGARLQHRIDATSEIEELGLYRRIYGARKLMAAAFERKYGALTTLRRLDLPKQCSNAPAHSADKTWESAQWIIREGVTKPYVDATYDRQLQESMPLLLLTRELEDVQHQDAAELIANQLTAAVSDVLFNPEEMDVPSKKRRSRGFKLYQS